MIKAAVIGVTAVLLSLFLSQVKKEYAACLILCSCILLFFLGAVKFEALIDQVKELTGYLSINQKYLEVLLKIAGVAYLSELSAGLCKDAGQGAVAGQIEMIGKLTILGFSLPVILSLFETMSRFF